MEWDIEIINETSKELVSYEPLIKAAAQRTLALTPCTQGELCITIVCDEQMKELNNSHRNKDATTDVLSFPQYEKSEINKLEYAVLGDIVISIEKAQAQADEYGHKLERELAFLTIHGTLHLLGYDHETNEVDEKEMFALQDKVLEEMDYVL